MDPCSRWRLCEATHSHSAPLYVSSENEPLSNKFLAYERLLIIATKNHPNSGRLPEATVMEDEREQDNTFDHVQE